MKPPLPKPPSRPLLLAGAVLVAACGRQPHLPDAPPAGDRCAPDALPEGPVVVEVRGVSGPRVRRALAWFPRGAGPFDVVVNLHEFRADPNRQAWYSRWWPAARDLGVILIAPDGKSSTWNAGDCCGKAMEQGIDDVAFLDTLVARVDAVACTSGRVLATGIGNGAMMAERWACESEAPDAVVSVGGSLQVDACPSSKPVPYLHYHGDADRFVPADGGDGILDGKDPARHRPVAHALDRWKARNRAGEPTVAVDEPALRCTAWSPAPGGAPTLACTFQGGDVWPGADNGTLATTHPLGRAADGALAWVRAAWEAPAGAPNR